MSVTISPWKYGRGWAYSITYDEALADLHRFAIPIHEEFGIPGHVEAVVGQLGEVRRIGNSSYNGFRHMSGSELRDLVDRGWGVGNHSWSHQVITPETADHEIGHAKLVLEEAISGPVDLYCAPGNNTNMAGHVLDACRRHGYLGAMSLTDALNRPGDELFWLNRTALHDQYYQPFFSEFDPYRNIRHAQAERGWVIDYCHCPLEEPVHRNKDCTHHQLRKRFETVLSEGGDDVWCAVPEEILFYHLARRHAVIETETRENGALHACLAFRNLSDRVTCRVLTLEADVPAAWCRDARVHVDGHPQPAEVVRPGRLRVTIDAGKGTRILFGPTT